jgi:hypothetical protein
MAVGVTLPPFPAAVDSYRPFKRRQEPNRLLKRRFETISANVGSDYLFRKIKENIKKIIHKRANGKFLGNGLH